MASGKPIVASDLPSIREVLNEKNSILVKPDDPHALADGITMLLHDGVLARSLAMQAHRDVQLYTWEARAQNIMDFISIATTRTN